MGRVLRVSHVERPEPELALKLMNPVALVSPRKRERFARELSILRDLDLEGVVRVVDAEPEGEAPYLVMELVEGRSLASLVASARRAGSEVAPPSGDGVGGVRATCDLLARLYVADDLAGDPVDQVVVVDDAFVFDAVEAPVDYVVAIVTSEAEGFTSTTAVRSQLSQETEIEFAIPVACVGVTP